jgi:hypothetical protein
MSEIDFSRGYEFLDKELQSIIKSSETDRRIGDKRANGSSGSCHDYQDQIWRAGPKLE